MTDRLPPTAADRAGRYIDQREGYRAFVPAPLPPNPSLNMTSTLQALLRKPTSSRPPGRFSAHPAKPGPVRADVRAQGGGTIQPDRRYRKHQGDLLEAEAKIYSPSRPKDVQEVFNYVDAMNLGLQRLTDIPVSVRLIREIHRRLLRGVRGSDQTPGELRTRQDWIGPAGCPIGDATFVPSPIHVVPNALSDLENLLHASDDLPLLIRVGPAHSQFETIHSFLDGNGRMGRLQITFLLVEGKALQKPVLYLSHFFKRNRQSTTILSNQCVTLVIGKEGSNSFCEVWQRSNRESFVR